ncbi:MAG: FtsX-like permease family protein [Flavobacteriales bacterium]|nr:FtsX-like permease family protein [Flavobacteriales bacterium]
MIRKLLFNHQDKKQLYIALLGVFIGITFLVTSVHYLLRVSEFGKDSEIVGANILVIQRKVTSSSTLNLTKTDFELEEIEQMKKEPFIEDVQAVVSNNFRVWLELNEKRIPPFKTDVFIQAVDKKFLDVKSDKWKWKKGDRFVPIIMPRDFIVMLNTFMSASGIPQISDELALDINFKLRISNGQKEEWVDSKIIGFTNEIPALLVPEEFMNYANANFSDGSEANITQVMIEGKEGEFGKLEAYMDEHGLESRNAQVVVSRLKSIVGTLFGVISGISVIAVLLSGLVLIQYLQLLMTHNKYEIRTLLRLGFAPKELINAFFSYFLKLFVIIASLGFLSFIGLKTIVDEIFKTGGINLNQSISWISVITLALSLLIFAISSLITANKGVLSLHNK